MRKTQFKTLLSILLMLFTTFVVVLGCDNDSSSNNSNTAFDGGDNRDIDAGEDSGLPSDTDSSDAGPKDTDDSGFVTIETTLGTVTGLIEGDARVFKGIPYAKPPVGDDRFKPPKAGSKWDVLDATEFDNICPQRVLMMDELTGDEDCLNLNIWSPATLPKDPLPVMVWLHGGAYKYGSGSESMYNASVLASSNGVLVVTINYRIGILGFLAHKSLSKEDSKHPVSGNYGLMDQRMALNWVREHIADYGGDPDNVTLFGESAGAVSVGMHLVSPQSEGLFQRAIIQSGPVMLMGSLDLSAAETRGDMVAKKLGCNDETNTLKCLREIPATDLVQFVEDAEETPGGLFFQEEDSDAIWAPVIDGVTIPKNPMEMLESGTVKPVPVIIGTNKDEGTIFLSFIMNPTDVADEAEYMAALDLKFDSSAQEVAARYPFADFETPNDAVSKITGDAFFISQTRRMARVLTKAGFDTYIYRFERAPEGFLSETLGVMHSAEIMFVFGMDNELGSIGEEGQDLSSAMMSYWTDFAASDDLNHNAAISWPLWNSDTEDHLLLDVPIDTAAGYYLELADFWDGILP
jgi:para-nitrobenzyl esterase